METEINISKCIDLKGRRQAFDGGGFLKNLKCKITLEISAFKEN
jgi:hypothetical protein